MLRIAGQTAGPNGLKLEGVIGFKKIKIICLKKNNLKKLHGQRRALQLVLYKQRNIGIFQPLTFV